MADRMNKLAGARGGTSDDYDQADFKFVKVKTEPVEVEEDRAGGGSTKGSLVVMRGENFTVELNPDYCLNEADKECKREQDMEVDSGSTSVSSVQFPHVASADDFKQEGVLQDIKIKCEQVVKEERVEDCPEVVSCSHSSAPVVDSQPLTALTNMCSVIPQQVNIQRRDSGIAALGSGPIISGLQTNMAQGVQVPLILPTVTNGMAQLAPSAWGVGVGGPLFMVVQPSLSGVLYIPSTANTVPASLPTGIRLVQSCPPGNGLQGRTQKILPKLAPKPVPKLVPQDVPKKVPEVDPEVVHRETRKAMARYLRKTVAMSLSQTTPDPEFCSHPSRTETQPDSNSKEWMEKNETPPHTPGSRLSSNLGEREAESGSKEPVEESQTLPPSSETKSCPNQNGEETESCSMEEGEDDSLKKYACSVCGRKFSFKQNMKTHFNALHLRDFKYECPECDKKFRYAKSRKGHVDSVHRKLRSHECPECKRGFFDQWGLKLHISNVHREEKNYTCSICGIKFGLKGRLIVHMESIHLGITRYACPFCGKEFYRNSAMQEHISVRHSETLHAAFGTS